MAFNIKLSSKSTIAPYNSYAYVRKLATALSIQCKHLLASDWATAVTISTNPQKPDAELMLFDNSDQAGALGYHDWDDAGNKKPYGRVFVQDDLSNDLQVSVTASHEMLEMALDPSCLTESRISTSTTVAWELCDPVEADNDGYEVSLGDTYGFNAVQVSNFILPNWFIPGSPPPYDYRRILTAPLTLRPGGYVAICVNGKWTQKFARQIDGEESHRSYRARRIEHRVLNTSDISAQEKSRIVVPYATDEVQPGEPVA